MSRSHLRIAKAPTSESQYRKPGCTCCFARRRDGVVERVFRLDDCPVHSLSAPTAEQRVAYYASHGSAPEQLSRQSRLWRVVDFGVLAVLRIVGFVGRMVGRKR